MVTGLTYAVRTSLLPRRLPARALRWENRDDVRARTRKSRVDRRSQILPTLLPVFRPTRNIGSTPYPLHTGRE